MADIVRKEPFWSLGLRRAQRWSPDHGIPIKTSCEANDPVGTSPETENPGATSTELATALGTTGSCRNAESELDIWHPAL
jgi:hypothetical protein